MDRFLLILSLALLCGCGIDRTISNVSKEDQVTITAFRTLASSSKCRIAKSSETGEALQLCLYFIDKTTREPLSLQEVYFYHANHEGEYQPDDPTDESTARLNGKAMTDKQGRIYLETILPGDYGSSSDNRHIHTTVFDARPEFYDIHFAQYTGLMGKQFIGRSDQHFLANLKRTAEGKLVSILSIEVKNPG